MALRTIHLFAGAGGGCLADVLLGHEIVCYVERDEYCCRVLEQRIRDGLLPDAPIWDDVRTFRAHEWRGKVDVVCGGFPCQPFSVAGKGLAADDDRNCWPETIDIIRCIRPRFAFLENVPNLTSGAHGYFGTILRDLAEAGFDAEWGVLSAADVGAPHIRKRLWILAANTDSVGVREQSERDTSGRFDVQRGGKAEPVDAGKDLADADYAGREEQRGAVAVGSQHEAAERAGERVTWWDEDPADRPAKSGVGRVVDGLAHRVHRLRATGNGQVPLVAATAWRLLRGGS